MDSLPLSIIKDRPYVVDEDYMSHCCRFIALMMPMPLMRGGVHELEVVELDFGPFDGNRPKTIVLLDLSL